MFGHLFIKTWISHLNFNPGRSCSKKNMREDHAG